MKNVLWASMSLVAAVLFFGCSSVNDSSNPDEMLSGSVQNSKQINALQGKRTDIPNWVYQGKKLVNGAYNCTIWVTDVAMSFTAPVYSCSTPTPICLYATWSPSGGSTSFVEFPPYTTDSSNQVYSLAAWGNYYIKAVDVYTVETPLENDPPRRANVIHVVEMIDALAPKILTQRIARN